MCGYKQIEVHEDLQARVIHTEHTKHELAHWHSPICPHTLHGDVAMAFLQQQARCLPECYCSSRVASTCKVYLNVRHSNQTFIYFLIHFDPTKHKATS
jgi:hypothetical protein